MTRVFAEFYASTYDVIYAEKDYAAECDLIEEAFERFGSGGIEKVLDFGCGTGGHSIPLAQRGYRMTGVDRSEPMLTQAREKASSGTVAVDWCLGDLRSISAGSDFDAVLMMFAVLCYQHENDEVRAALRNARSHLRPGGLLILDAWYGPTVLQDPPDARTKEVQGREGTVRRGASSELDVRSHLCAVRYQVSDDFEADEEVHVVRYFFPREIELFLEVEGFTPLALSRFGSLDDGPAADSRDVIVVAKAD